MKHRRVWIVWAIPLALALVIVLAIVVLFPREKKLVERAKRIGSTALWSQDSSGDYFWLTDNSVLCYRYENSNSEEEAFRVVFYRYDLTTLNATRLDKLNALFHDTAGDSGDIHLSPDGAWLLWKEGKGGVTAARLDGTRSQHYQDKDIDGAILCWLGDNRWVALHSKSRRREGSEFDRAILHDLDSAKPINTLSFAPETPQAGGCFGMVSTGAGSDHLLGDTACWEGVEATDEVVELGVGTQIGPTQRHKIQLPKNVQIEEMIYSFKGDRIAWVFRNDYTLPFQEWMHRLYPRYQAKTRSVISVWVSAIDGSRMHEVGHIDLVEDEEGGATAPTAKVSSRSRASVSSSEELDLGWMPDEKHLSFTYQDTLWSIPTD